MARSRPETTRERGAVAVEFALVTPLLLLVVLGGVQLGRVLVTRHRLADATSYAARAAAVSRQTDLATVQEAVRSRLGNEVERCTSFSVQAVIVPGAFEGSQALQVTTICSVRPMFNGEPFVSLSPHELTVTAAMPL